MKNVVLITLPTQKHRKNMVIRLDLGRVNIFCNFLF